MSLRLAQGSRTPQRRSTLPPTSCRKRRSRCLGRCAASWAALGSATRCIRRSPMCRPAPGRPRSSSTRSASSVRSARCDRSQRLEPSEGRHEAARLRARARQHGRTDAQPRLAGPPGHRQPAARPRAVGSRLRRREVRGPPRRRALVRVRRAREPDRVGEGGGDVHSGARRVCARRRQAVQGRPRRRGGARHALRAHGRDLRAREYVHAPGRPVERARARRRHRHLPWHCSRFDLTTGDVQGGPAVYPEPRYEASVRAGKVELRTAREQQVRAGHGRCLAPAVFPGDSRSAPDTAGAWHQPCLPGPRPGGA
jgi:hypothetical protein